MQFKILFYFGTLTFLFAPKAYAYLDPGTGSYVVQVLIAAILGSTLFFRQIWAKLKEIFHLKKKESDES